MKKKTLLLLGIVLFVIPVGAQAIVPPPPVPAPSNPPAPSSPGNTNSMMGPSAQNVLGTALDLKEKAHSLLDQALEQDLDVSELEDLLDKADELLEKAQKILRANPIPASNMLREAAQIYEDVISDLEALLG
jgi:hypothetical protein